MKLELGIEDLKAEHMQVPLQQLVISADIFNESAQNALRVVGEGIFYNSDKTFSHPVKGKPIYAPVETEQSELVKLMQAGWTLIYNTEQNRAILTRVNKQRIVNIDLFHYMLSRAKIYLEISNGNEQVYGLRIS